MYSIEHRIEQLRSQLIYLTNNADSFTDERVIQLSQKLDRFIVEYQKLMYPSSSSKTPSNL